KPESRGGGGPLSFQNETKREGFLLRVGCPLGFAALERQSFRCAGWGGLGLFYQPALKQAGFRSLLLGDRGLFRQCYCKQFWKAVSASTQCCLLSPCGKLH